MLNVSSYALERLPNFQSTLRHELGHGFGLPHVDVYGKDMKSTPSMMAYNTAYWTRGFDEPAAAARFIASLISLALTSIAPRKIYGKPNTLFT